MRIVVDARELRTSTGRYVERLLHYLQQIDKRNDYTVLLKPKDIAGWKPASPRFTPLVCPYKEFTFSEQLGLLRQLNQLKADLVHFPMVQQPVLYRSNVVTTMQDLTTIRFRNHSKNWLVFTCKQQVYKLVNKYVARKSSQIITPTEYVKKDVANYCHVRPSKITVTLEAADPINEPPKPVSLVNGKHFILYVGRPAVHKNLSRLVDAFKILKVSHHELHLVFAGKLNAEYELLREEVRRKNVANVIFTDFVSDGQLRWLYEHAKAYVFPSLSEGFGLPGLEAMLHGAPVASSKATCLPEVYGEAALYFDPEDSAQMAQVIERILSDPDLAKVLVTKGKQRAAQFSWQRMAEQTLKVYEKACADQKS